MRRKILSNKILFLCVSVFFVFSTVLQAAPLLGPNPAFGPNLLLGQVFTSPLITGVQVDDKNPFLFNFFVHPGDDNLSAQSLNQEAEKMIKYFLASLTIPEKDLWVNLSPYEENRVIEENFSKTDMGRDLLEQDYLLKQMVGALVHPEGEVGKEFWKKIYKKFYELFGTTEVSVDSLNKVWIVPEKAIVYQRGNAAFVAEAKLKVMLEEDYVALEHSSEALSVKRETQDFSRDTLDSSRNKLSSDIVREIIIPTLEKEVNEGKNFAQLRQIYNALILADWFKKRLSNNLINHVYTSKRKTSGIDSYDQTEAKRIYSQYIENYKKGVCNYIKTEYDPFQEKYVPRKYFSGGVKCMNVDAQVVEDLDSLSSSGFTEIKKKAIKYQVVLRQTPLKLPTISSSVMILPKDGSIFNNQFAVRNFVDQLPQENREWHMENLKEWVIKNAERYLNETFSDDMRWYSFVTGILPAFGFSDQQTEEIVDRLEIGERILDISPDVNRLPEWKMIEFLRESIWPAAKTIAGNIISYLMLKKGVVKNDNTSESFTNSKIFSDNISVAFSKIKGSYNLYPYLRQIIKDTSLSSSRIKRIDELMRIAEREVNVSSHKGQDLLDPLNLAIILKSGHQRRRSGPNATYDPEVTKALEELISLLEDLTGKSDVFVKDIEDAIEKYGDKDILSKFKIALNLFSQKRNLEALSELTSIRSELYFLIIERIKTADYINHSSEKRYGSHISQSREKAIEAYKLIEADILIEQIIVDSSIDVFSLMRDRIDLKELKEENIRDIISAVYIIAKNMVHAVGAQPALDIFAENLINLRDRNKYKEEDYYRIFGLIQQIQAELDDIVINLTKEFKPRVEFIQKKQGLKNFENTPESLGFPQDFLVSTMLSQFHERFLLDCRKIIDQIEGPKELTMTVDPVSQKKVRRIANIPINFEKIPSIIGLREATDDILKAIGSKAYGLYVMAKLGMPVPPWFIIRSDPNEERFHISKVKEQLQSHIQDIEKESGTKMGHPDNPLLFSLRSVFQISMPGEFSTVLNVGMNDKVFEGLKKNRGEKFALISYINFLKTYAELMSPLMSDESYFNISRLHDQGEVEDLRETLNEIKSILSASKINIPQDPWDQIEIIADAIMNYSMTPDIRNFLACQGVPDSWKVSVIFQEMDFGYLNEGSYTGVVHTRDVLTGKNSLHVELTRGTTGVAVVGDRRVSHKIQDDLPEEDKAMIEKYKLALERKLGGPVELEITRGDKLKFLQARTAHLNPSAMLFALESLMSEGVLSEEEAAFQKALASILANTAKIQADDKPLVVAGGLSEGVMAGAISLSFDKAKETMKEGKNAILILETTTDRKDTSHRSLYGKRLGAITAHGGPNQHYAVLARDPRNSMPYISMVDGLEVDLEKRKVKLGGKWFSEGDMITMDGYRGLIFEGDVIKRSQLEAGQDYAGQEEVSSSVVGGIDLSRSFELLNIKIDESGSPLPVEFQNIDQIQLRGLIPVILDVTPVGNPLSFLDFNI